LSREKKDLKKNKGILAKQAHPAIVLAGYDWEIIPEMGETAKSQGEVALELFRWEPYAEEQKSGGKKLGHLARGFRPACGKKIQHVTREACLKPLHTEVWSTRKSIGLEQGDLPACILSERVTMLRD